MALNYIFVGFFLVSFAVALLRLIGYLFRDSVQSATGFVFTEADGNVFSEMVDSTFQMASTSVEIAVYLIGIMALWLGILKIGEHGGAVASLTKIVSPIFKKLFPAIPANHPAMGSMMMNFAANMLGLDNAATPLGLKAMSDLQATNKEKSTASDPMIMFLVLNTSGLTLIPVSVMGLRAAAGAENPTDVFLPILIATFFATLAGLIFVAIRQKINLFNRAIFGVIGGITALILLMLYGFSQADQATVSFISSTVGNGILIAVICLFMYLAVRKKINVYDAFIEGAKEGFQVAINIIPYLVAMLVAIGVFRASGTLDLITDMLAMGVGAFGMDTAFVDGLPTALMKPLSGSGARGMMVETMDHFGADSFAGRLSSVFQGSTETTFYVLAVYFGAVKISNTRYAAAAGIFADVVGILAAIAVTYLFFG